MPVDPQASIPAPRPVGNRFWTFLRILNVRLRFIFLMVLVGLVAGYWDTQALGRLLARYVSSPTATDALTLHLAFTHALWLQKRGEHRAADL